MRRPVIVLLTIVAIAAAGYAGYRQWGGKVAVSQPATGQGQKARAQAAIPVVTVAAEQGEFPVRRRSIGLLESPAVVTVRSRIDSQMLEKHVNDGQLVRKG